MLVIPSVANAMLVIPSVANAVLVISSVANAMLVIPSVANAMLVIPSVANAVSEVEGRPKRILGALAAMLFASTLAAQAAMPSIAELDADARAVGNMKPLAQQIGDRIFATPWPAEVSQISANGVDGHVVVGVRLWGVKFHAPLNRAGFLREVYRLIGIAFSSAPNVGEVDLWASIPIVVGKDVVVSGDLAVPTTRPVYTISVRRGEDPSRAQAFWDEEWARAAFKQDW